MIGDWFDKVYERQVALQNYISTSPNYTVTEPIVQVYNSATSAIVELCEMLQSDTRWKKHITGSQREAKVDVAAFSEELADAFIYLVNILIFYGIDSKDAKAAIDSKITKNYWRFNLI